MQRVVLNLDISRVSNIHTLQDHGLLDNLPEDYRNLTKEQRQQMHASRKQLRSLKRDQQMASVKRKVLKLDQDVSSG